MVTVTTDTWDGAPTEAEIVDYCLRFKPDEAAVKSDSSLCVTPLILRMTINGEVVELAMKDGKYAAHEIRVSGDRQRTLALLNPEERPAAKKSRQKTDGFSEQEQIVRGIRYCIQNRLAFKIYSDAGVTGEYPNNDEALIKKLLKKKAARYRRIFTKVLLDEASLSRRSESEITSMHKYLDKRCETILRAGISEEDAYKPAESDGEARSLIRRRGRSRRRVYYRQAFSQLWADVETNRIHEVTACESSRICRDADLQIAFLQLLHEHEVQLHGLVDQILSLDVSDPMNKGMLYFLASHHEARLLETATATFRGSVQRLEAGRHTGRLPWWIETDDRDYPILVPDRVRIVQKILDLYLAGQGVHRIGTRLIADGDLVKGKSLTDRQIDEVIGDDTIRGKSRFYGLEWDVLPAAITDVHLLNELAEMKETRKGAIPYLTPANWSDHLLTGLLRCSCGASMNYQQPYANRPSNLEGSYRCFERHGTDKGSHATIDAKNMEDFLAELVSKNPTLLSGALAGSLSPGSVAERTAQRALLEAALKEAEESFTIQQEEARGKAGTKAIALGVPRTSEGYGQIVDGLVKNEMAEARQKLDSMREEIAHLRVEATRKNRDEKLLKSLEELQDWEKLDVLTKNRLLRSVFSDIIVYSRKGENKIEIKLNGISEPLAPVFPRHTNREAVRLPSVAEWLDDTYDPEGVQQVRPLSVNEMRSLNQCWDELAHVDGAMELRDFCRANKIRTTDKAALKSYQRKLQEKGANDRLLMILENVYQAFVQVERARLVAKNTGAAGQTLPAE